MRLRKTRVAYRGVGPLRPNTEREIDAPYFEPVRGEDSADFLRHLGKVAEEQEARIERFEYYLADIYDRLRGAGLLSVADAETLGRINELMIELEKRGGSGG